LQGKWELDIRLNGRLPCEGDGASSSIKMSNVGELFTADCREFAVV
jgi:hypothetical protein